MGADVARRFGDRAAAVRLAPYLVVAVAFAYFAYATLAEIARPGLQYDEALFVNAALGGDYPSQAFIYSRVFDVPTQLMSYIGALKAWMYAPVFELAGVSVASIRVPAVLLAMATIALAFVLGKRLFNPWIGAALAILVATDPVYAVMAKADWGPVALSSLFRLSALVVYFQLIRTGSLRYLYLLLGALALGLFNKFDFLAFIAALGIAALVVHGPELLRLLLRHRWRLALPVLVAVGLIAYVGVELIIPAGESQPVRSLPLWIHARAVWHMYSSTMNGTAVFQYMTLTPLAHPTVTNLLVYPALAITGVLGLISFRRPRDSELWRHARTGLFFFVLFGVMAIALAGTPQAGGPHHVMLLWPLPALLAVSLVAVATQLPVRVRNPWLAAAALAVASLAITQVRTSQEYLSGFAKTKLWSPIWNTEIEPLARVVDAAAPRVDSIVTADWGIGNQVFALGNDATRTKLNDTWATFTGAPNTPQAHTAVRAALLDGRRVLVLYHVPGREIMPGSNVSADGVTRPFAVAGRTTVAYSGTTLRALIVDGRAPARAGAQGR